jgi:lipopolysaccharide transport system ATP-binding protein
VGSLLEVGTGFHPELSGRDNVYLNGAILGMKREEIGRKFDEIVAFAEVERFIDTPVKRYSSGMYVRLAFAVAAHLEPEVMIVDEVLAVGDTSFQNKCLGKMKDVAGHGRTVLYVSHNLPSVVALCGTGLLLEAGRLTMAGGAREVVGRYLQTIGAADGDAPLSDRRDRSGDGSIRLVSLHVESTDGDGPVRINSGLRITVGYRSDAPVRYPSIRIGIDDHSVGIFGLDSNMTGGLPDVLPPEGKICCTTDPINLAPGRYYLHVLLEHAGIAADYVQGAGYFDVEAEDLFGTGRLPDREWAMCVLSHRWFVEGE